MKTKKHITTCNPLLSALVKAVGEVEAEVQQGVLEGSKVLRAMRSVLKGMTLSWGYRSWQNIVPTAHRLHGQI